MTAIITTKSQQSKKSINFTGTESINLKDCSGIRNTSNESTTPTKTVAIRSADRRIWFEIFLHPSSFDLPHKRLDVPCYASKNSKNKRSNDPRYEVGRRSLNKR